MSETTHEIKMAQAVTRWVKGVKERAQHRTRVSGSDCNTSDAEYVAAHIERQAARIAELEAIVERFREAFTTKDGVEVCVGDMMYYPSRGYCGYVEEWEDDDSPSTFTPLDETGFGALPASNQTTFGYDGCVCPAECFSSIEAGVEWSKKVTAARAAQEARDD